MFRTIPAVLAAAMALLSITVHGEVAGDARAQAIHEYLRRLTGFGYAGAVLVKERDAVLVRGGFGLAQAITGRGNTPETVFDIASVSKGFTAVAILALEEDGRLQVTDPIQRHLENVPADKAGVTIQHLLQHTAGFPRGLPPPSDSAAVVKAILAHPLAAAPGTAFAYSNSGYVLLAAIVERASGRPFVEFMQDRVFRRAGLTATGFWGAHGPRVPPEQVAQGHDDFGRQGVPLDWKIGSVRDLGHTGIVSTVDDLGRWVEALASGKVVARSRIDRMWTPGAGGYGLGWFVSGKPGARVVSHDGDGFGFGAHVSWAEASRTLVVALSNVRIDWAPIHTKADSAIHALLAGSPVTMPPDFGAADQEVLTRRAGTYEIDAGNRLLLSVRDGRLSVGAEGQDAVDLLRPPADAAPRRRRSTLAEIALRQYLRGDVSGFKQIGLEAPDALAAVRDEIASLSGGNGDLRSFQVLGTYPAGQPGIDNTIIRLQYARGCGSFKWRWDGDVLDGTYTRSTNAAAPTYLQPRSADTFIGWNILEETPPALSMTFSRAAAGEILTVSNGARTATARRVADGPCGAPAVW